MASFYLLSHRWALAIALLLTLGLQNSWAASDPIYSFTGPSGAQVIQTCTTISTFPVELVSCFGSVTQARLATDNDFNTAAIMEVPGSVGASSIRLRVDMARRAPAFYRAGMVISRNTDVLNLLSLRTTGLLVVRTYIKDGSRSLLQEEKVVDAKIINSLLTGVRDKLRIEFVAQKEFDQVELEAASLLSLPYSLNVYYAYAIDANVVQQANGYVSRFATPPSTSYGTGVVKDGITVCVNSNVTNPQNSVDKDLTNFAILGSVADLSCPVTLQTQLEGVAPAGYNAGFVLGSRGVLDVNVLDDIQVTTYLGGVRQESASGSRLLDLNVLPNQQYNVNFETTLPFDRVEIQRTSLLSALDNLQVYYGFGVEPRVFSDQQPLLSDFVDPAGNYQVNGSVACLSCNVSNPQNAADKDLEDNYASINTPLALGGTTRLKLRLDGAGKAGNVAGAVLGLGAELLDLDLLSNIRVSTYSGTNGGELVESVTGRNLLGLELLADGRQEISFLTTRNFEWVEIEITNGVSLLSNTQVYYGFAEDRPTGFPSSITVPAPLPVQLVAFSAKASGSGVSLAWQTATELNSSHFVVERAVSASTNFQAIGRVTAAGSSNSTKNYGLRDAEAAALNAPILYYRLRQVDLDGKESFSSVAVVTMGQQQAALALYPNPAIATDIIRAELRALPEGEYRLALYNMQGSLISQQIVNSRSTVVPTSALRAGLYQVVLLSSTGQSIATQRLAIKGH